MSAAKLIYHIDDSMVARKLMHSELKHIDPQFEVKSFASMNDLVNTMTESPGVTPWVILTDYNMPQHNGLDILDWIKRHPSYHHIPVVLITAEGEFGDICKRMGAFRYLNKPVDQPGLKDLFSVLSDRLHDPEAEASLNASFCEELEKVCEELADVSQAINEATSQVLYRLLHTVKGTSYSLQYPTIGYLVHEAENMLSAMQDAHAFNHPEPKAVIQDVIQFLYGQSKNLSERKPIDKFNDNIIKRIEEFVKDVKLGKIAPASEGSSSGSQSSSQSSSPNGGFSLTERSNVVRLKNEQVDDLYSNFKKIIQLKNRINSFAYNLKNEFYDESFPNELVTLGQELNHETLEVMEFLVSLRLVSPDRLKRFAEVVAKEAADKASKKVNITFIAEPHLEIDREVLEGLEQNLLHIIRNSVDHGIEPLEKRQEVGKNPVGQIKLEIKKKTSETLLVTITDDGGGIDPEKLKVSMLKKNIISENDLNGLKKEQILDLIFVDGVSTKTAVTEVSGRGVGLSAVKDNINKAGGKIRVDSNLGVGTQFSIEMPRIFKL